MTVVTQMSFPAEERRGGEAPDWDAVEPGEELPEREDPELYPPEQLAVPFRRRPGQYGDIADWCGHPDCGGDLQ